MNKQKALKLVNPLLGLVFMIQALTGMLHSVIPYEYFRPVHGVTGWLLVILASVHVGLNWSWIMANMKKKGK